MLKRNLLDAVFYDQIYRNSATDKRGEASSDERKLGNLQRKLDLGKKDFEKLLFRSGCSLSSKLRSTLIWKFKENGFVVYKQVKKIIQDFLTQVQRKGCSRETPMPHPFLCSCGWLFLHPATLPCGHTMCKHCIDESMLCSECGYTLDTPCTPSTFLQEIICQWFKTDHQALLLKKEAKNHLENKEYLKSLNSIQKVLQIITDDSMALNIRSEIYTNLKDYRNALRDAELSCKINPSNGKLQFQRGISYCNVGDLNNAIDAFQLCLELEPDNLALSNAVVASIDKILAPQDFVKSEDVKERLETLESPDVTDSESDETACEESMNKVTEFCTQNTQSSSKNLVSDNLNPCSSKLESSSLTESSESNISDGIKYEEQHKNRGETSPCKNESQNDNVELLHGVPINLIKEDDFECKLCYELLYKPVTTPCGHVFCKNCLIRTLDHNPSCPICRVSLKDYMADQLKPETSLILTIMKIYFKEQFLERDKLYRERLEELSRVGVDEEVEIPIFVCSIAFPYVSCPLHIFEPKYRMMVRESLESGSKKFGMCIPKPGRTADNEFSDIGTICEIKKHDSLPDGRFIVHTVAGQRFIVQRKKVADSLIYAKVTYFCDEPEDLSQGQLAITSGRIYNSLTEYVNNLKTAERDCIFNALGKLPLYEDNYPRYTHGVPWVWWGLAALPLNMATKLILLRSRSVSERMLSLQRFLKFLTKLNANNEPENT